MFKLGNAGLNGDSSPEEVLLINYIQNQVTKALQDNPNINIEEVMRTSASEGTELLCKIFDNNLNEITNDIKR